MKLLGKILQIIVCPFQFLLMSVSQILKATLHDIDASVHAYGK